MNGYFLLLPSSVSFTNAFFPFIFNNSYILSRDCVFRMANAKARGVKVGKPHTTRDDIPAVFYKHYPTYLAGNMNVSELARVCGLSRPTVYKYIKLIK